MLWSIATNTIFPVVLYKLSLRYVSPSELTALIFATLYPIAESSWMLWRSRRASGARGAPGWAQSQPNPEAAQGPAPINVDPIGVMVLLGILVDAVAITLGGSPKLLLLRESFVTGAFGLTCFASLVAPRPLMFYFGRYFMAGGDPTRRARYDASWSLPEVRRGNRLVTSVWGLVFTGELALRVLLVFTLSPAAVLVISPLLLGVLTVVTAVWSLAYAARMRARVLPRLTNAPGALP